MRRAARSLAVALLLALPGFAMAGLSVTGLNGGPTSVLPGQLFTVIFTVQNSGAATLSNVSPDLGVMPTGFGPVLVSGPSPAAQPIAPYNSAVFNWTFSGTDCGEVVFTASASGLENATPVASGVSLPFHVYMVCTPTPTPSPTPAFTATPTPWIVYGTATPPPSEPNASIPGNLFHPLNGGQLQLRYDAPYEGLIQVDLFDRLGHKVKHFERTVMPGSYSELWDGRSEDGLLVSSGIYAAQFRGKGLSRIVKFAVIK